jgi:hypothetical protein
MLKKKIWPSFPRIFEVFTQKIVTKPSKIWVWDPGSEIRDPEKTYSGSQTPDPGSRGQKGTGSRIQIRNTDNYNTSYNHYYNINLKPKVKTIAPKVLAHTQCINKY